MRSCRLLRNPVQIEAHKIIYYCGSCCIWRAIWSNRAMWAVHVAAFVMWLWTPWCGGLPGTTDSTVYNCTCNFFSFFLTLSLTCLEDIVWRHWQSFSHVSYVMAYDILLQLQYFVYQPCGINKCLNLMFLVSKIPFVTILGGTTTGSPNSPGGKGLLQAHPMGSFFFLFFKFIFIFLLHALLFMPFELFPLGPLSTGRSYRESAWRQSVCGRVMLNPGRCCFDRLFKSISAPPVPAFSAGVCEWAWRKGN